LALLFTSRPTVSLGFRKPDWAVLFLAIPLALAIHPVAVELGHVIRKVMPVSPEVENALKMLTENASPFELLIAFAVLPAICEEIAFRGFILSGLSRKHPVGRAIVISSILFGVFHMMPQQMLTASLLGLLLGLLAIRSGSIFPGMLYHVLHNGLLVVQGAALEEEGYGLLVTLGGALAAILMIGYLIYRPSIRRLPYFQGAEEEEAGQVPVLTSAQPAKLSTS
jgi:sodium transport system permease protein